MSNAETREKWLDEAIERGYRTWYEAGCHESGCGCVVEHIKGELKPLYPLLRALEGLAEDLRNPSPAHTYASENADLYRGFDNGSIRAGERLAAILDGMGVSK